MPRGLKTDFDPDALVPVRALVPGWLKNEVSQQLQAQGKTLTDWIRDQMRALVSEAETRPGVGARRSHK
jgi:hypothetical protein